MSREVVLVCTDRSTHDRVTLHAWMFDVAVSPDEYVRWAPVSSGETLQLRCDSCGREWWLGNDRGGRLIGELERRSRTLGRVVFDLSGTDL